MAAGRESVDMNLAELLAWTGGRVVNADAYVGGAAAIEKLKFSRLADLGTARAGEAAFFFSRAYQADLLRSAASIIVTGEAFVGPLKAAGLPQWKTSAFVACDDPYLALAKATGHVAERASTVGPRPLRIGPPSVHASAVVDPTAHLENGVEIGPNAVIGPGARVGRGSRIGAGCTLGQGVVIGEGVELFPSVHVYELTEIGDRSRVHAGAVIGADGFGYAPTRVDGKPGAHQKIYHLGRVLIGRDVEIGANTCIDRGTLGDTVIGDGAKLDNLVQIGHNVHVGEGAILCGSAAVAGSARVGRFAMIGGLTGITNQVVVGDGARIAALSLISRDVPAGTEAAGNPQREGRSHFKAHAYLNQLLEERRASRGKGD